MRPITILLARAGVLFVIEQWHAHGKATGQWAPFRGALPGGVELTRIKLRVARN